LILSKKLYLKRGFIQGLWISFRYLFTVVVTFFKSHKYLKADTSRKVGLPILTTKNDGDLQCNACGLCIGHCPTNALDLKSSGDDIVEDFKLDILKCVLCGLCQDVCPIDAIRMSHHAPQADHAEASWVIDAKEMSKDKVISRLA